MIDLKERLEKVTANPATIPWVSDTWGLTSELKDVFKKMSSRINGSDAKAEIMFANITIGFAHLKARHERDKAAKAPVVNTTEKADG